MDKILAWIKAALRGKCTEINWFFGAAFLSTICIGLGMSGTVYGAKWWEVMAAFGTVGAVVTSLWLADAQRRKDVESLVVTPAVSIIQGVSGRLLSLNVVSNGIRPATVKGVAIVSKHASAKLQVLYFYHQSMLLPACLLYGDSLDLICKRGFQEEIENFLVEYCDSKADGLEVEVTTTLQSFRTPLDGLILDVISRSFQPSA